MQKALCLEIGVMCGHINMPLLVKTKIKPSSIEGLGLFAEQDIPKGTVIWKHDDLLDGWFYSANLSLYSEATKDYIKHFCCYDKNRQGWIKSCDNANWMNHCDWPNIDSPNYYIHIANRDIMIGEELIVDYDTIGDDDEFFDCEFTTS